MVAKYLYIINIHNVKNVFFQLVINNWLTVLLSLILWFMLPQISLAGTQTREGLDEFISLSYYTSDTIPPDLIPMDSTAVDTLDMKNQPESYNISESAIQEAITFEAEDSLSFNNVEKGIELYNRAKVVSGVLKLEAGYIGLDMEDNIVHARGVPDSVGVLSQFPDMYMERENFKARELKYNLRKSKGIIISSYREQDDLYIRSAKTKFVEEGEDRVLYNADGIITSCEHPEPHYGIRSRKQKLVLDKIAVIGPSNIELGGIPTPLWLPFGFFPITAEGTTGIIFPKDYEYSPSLGFGLNNVGYYFPINDHVDLIASTDIYLRGSFRVSLESRYSKRYKYSGGARISYASIKQEIIDREAGVIKVKRSPSFGITLNHNQDQKADPTRKFGGSVNIETNNFRKDNFNDAQSVIQNSLSSNLSYSQQMFNNNATFTAGLAHSQNTATNDITLSFPNVNLNVRRLYPFKKKARIGKEKWYEGLSFKYDGEFKNTVNTKDTLLLTRKTLDTLRFGAQHKFSSDHTFNIFKYINVRPSVNFSSAWYPGSIHKELKDEYRIKHDTIRNNDGDILGIKADTLEYGIVEKTKIQGFKTQNLFNAQLALNTTLYGTLRFSKGWLRGLRHVAKPYFSFDYTPDYGKWGYFDEYVNDLRADKARNIRYSIFEDGIFSQPPNIAKLGLSYGIDNVFDAKIFSKKDSTEKNVKLLPRLGIRSGYNYIADSFKMAPVVFNGNFSLFRSLSTVTFEGGFSMYDRDSTGRVIDEYLWDNDKGYLRFEGFKVQLSTNISVRQVRDIIADAFGMKKEDKNYSDGVASVFDRLSINHHLQMAYERKIDRDTFYINSHEISIVGNIQLSPNWSINVGRIGYSFQQKRITYPDLGFTRNLHCWNMSFSWQPQRGSYNFFIGVNPGTLDFIKAPYRRNQFDPSQAFF